MANVVGFDEKYKKRVTCKGSRGCGAIIEYDARDIREYNGTDYSGDSDGMEWVDCPNCKERAVIRSW